MSIEISNLSIQTDNIVIYVIIGFLAVIIYSSRTFFDVLIRRITCQTFGHDFEGRMITNINFIQCRRCSQISHDYNKIKPKKETD